LANAYYQRRLRRESAGTFSQLLKGRKMEATRIMIDEVKQRMDRGEQFAFVDTRNPKAWGEAKTKLPGAIRVPADEVEQYLTQIPRDRTAITYCT